MVESTTRQLLPPLNLLETEGSGSEGNCRTPVCPRHAANSNAVSLLKPGVGIEISLFHSTPNIPAWPPCAAHKNGVRQ